MIEASAPVAPDIEEKAVRGTLQRYIDGIRAGDLDLLRTAFHPQAIMTGYLGPEPMVVPIDALWEVVQNNPSPAESGAPFTAAVESVEVTGATATAVVTEEGYLGHDFRDAFQLLKLDGEWRIMAKLFTTV